MGILLLAKASGLSVLFSYSWINRTTGLVLYFQNSTQSRRDFDQMHHYDLGLQASNLQLCHFLLKAPRGPAFKFILNRFECLSWKASSLRFIWTRLSEILNLYRLELISIQEFSQESASLIRVSNNLSGGQGTSFNPLFQPASLTLRIWSGSMTCLKF